LTGIISANLFKTLANLPPTSWKSLSSQDEDYEMALKIFIDNKGIRYKIFFLKDFTICSGGNFEDRK